MSCALSYSFEEVFAEKVRALAERCRPRDLYDVVHLFRTQRFQANRPVLVETLAKKCSHKNIAVPTHESIAAHPYRRELETEWDAMLRHQLSALPPISTFLDELPSFFAWLEEGAEVEEPAPYTAGTAAAEELWVPPPRAFMPSAIGVSAPYPGVAAGPGIIEQIRMAATNRVCVQLTFNSKVRLVEPYSFRRTNRGKIVFYGHERDVGHVKCYTVANIQAAAATSMPFSPKFRVEIGFPVSAPRRRGR